MPARSAVAIQFQKALEGFVISVDRLGTESIRQQAPTEPDPGEGSYRAALERIAGSIPVDERIEQPDDRHGAWAARVARSALANVAGSEFTDPIQLNLIGSPARVPVFRVSLRLPTADDQLIVEEYDGPALEPAQQPVFNGSSSSARVHLKITPSQRAQGYEPRAYRLGADSRNCEYLVAGVARWQERLCPDQVLCFRQIVHSWWRCLPEDTHWYAAAVSGFVEGALKRALANDWKAAADSGVARKLGEIKDTLPKLEFELVTRHIEVFDWGGRPVDVTPSLIGAELTGLTNVVVMAYPRHWESPKLALFHLANDLVALHGEIPQPTKVERSRRGNGEGYTTRVIEREIRRFAWFFRRTCDARWTLLDHGNEQDAVVMAEWETLARLAR